MRKANCGHGLRGFATSIARSISTNKKDWNSIDSFFGYTRARFVMEEAKEMEIRRVQFDINELAKTAARSIGATECVNIEKCPDGLYNKAFVFTMEDSRQVIGKVPNPNAGTPHFTTASEVATMEFMRTVLKTPVPKVYEWSSAKDTTIGAEFIIMEKAPGIPLSKVWASMGGADKVKILAKIFEHQRMWSSIEFPQFGSLYYSKDVKGSWPADHLYIDSEGNKVHNSKFTVGPISNFKWFANGRDRIRCDRGPWNSVFDYKKVIALREMEAIRTIRPFPRQLGFLYGDTPLYQPTVEKKMAAIESYRKVFKALLPTDPVLLKGHLWHNDFHDENIFVNPDNPIEITGIIDWQSVHIAPLFEHAIDPLFLGYNGHEIGENLDKPKQPENLDSLPERERIKETNAYLEKALMIAWRRLVKNKSPAQYKAIQFGNSPIGVFLGLARCLFDAGEASFRALLLDIRDDWNNDGPGSGETPVGFPLEFSEAEMAEIEKDHEAAEFSMETMAAVSQQLGRLWPGKGLAEHEVYDEVKVVLEEVKKELMN